ncbi:Uncharacterised protein [Vibrio cholerae]|nr:Uncharacterised protein [Vibrio cholerae]CSI07021.1 Uncharacterised protein [Vibrio cholerae]
MISRPSSFALPSRINIIAAAPSVSGVEFAAVTEPY